MIIFDVELNLLFSLVDNSSKGETGSMQYISEIFLQVLFILVLISNVIAGVRATDCSE